MPDEDKNFGGSLVLDFRKWWCHMQDKNTVKTELAMPSVRMIARFDVSMMENYAPSTTTA